MIQTINMSCDSPAFVICHKGHPINSFGYEIFVDGKLRDFKYGFELPEVASKEACDNIEQYKENTTES